MKLNVPLVLGTRRVGRRSEHVARYLLTRLAELDRTDTELLDLGEYDLPILERRMDQLDPVPDDVARWSSKVSAADGLVIVAPEYKNSIPGALKNALDYLAPGVLRRRPIGLVTVSSGALGGVVCLSQLRVVCHAMGGLPIPDQLLVPHVKQVFDDNGRLRDDDFADRANRFLREVVWYTDGLAHHRADTAES